MPVAASVRGRTDAMASADTAKVTALTQLASGNPPTATRIPPSGAPSVSAAR
ncbi:hypothetical protein [Fodinicola feengrottensis]|uniref:hypothetical protein n=1 Tax=Fodinicola feengrottensis TaxID=435914 RepID=UPI0024414EEB|nr:hypothetical protein [Fodinicola feengrottensis]